MVLAAEKKKRRNSDRPKQIGWRSSAVLTRATITYRRIVGLVLAFLFLFGFQASLSAQFNISHYNPDKTHPALVLSIETPIFSLNFLGDTKSGFSTRTIPEAGFGLATTYRPFQSSLPARTYPSSEIDSARLKIQQAQLNFQRQLDYQRQAIQLQRLQLQQGMARANRSSAYFSVPTASSAMNVTKTNFAPQAAPRISPPVGSTSIPTSSGLKIVVANEAQQFEHGLPTNARLNKCGPDAFSLRGNCISRERLIAACRRNLGAAKWSRTAFVCDTRAKQRAQSKDDDQAVQTRKNERAVKQRARDRATVSNATRSGNQLYSNQICQRQRGNAITKTISGKVCQSANRRTSSGASGGIVGSYSFLVLSGDVTPASLACATQRVEAIVKSTMTHYRGKSVNASKVYSFCNLAGAFQVSGTF